MGRLRIKQPAGFHEFLILVRKERRQPVWDRIAAELAPRETKAGRRFTKVGEETGLKPATLQGVVGGTANLSDEKIGLLRAALQRRIGAEETAAAKASAAEAEAMQRRVKQVSSRIEDIDLSVFSHPHDEINAETRRRYDAFQNTAGGAAEQEPADADPQPDSAADNGKPRLPTVVVPRLTDPFGGAAIGAFVSITPPGGGKGCGLFLTEGQEIRLTAAEGGGINIHIPPAKAPQESDKTGREERG